MKMRRSVMLLGMMATFAMFGCDGGYDPPAEAEPMDSIAPMPKAPVVPETDEPGE
ncbi:MAG TPA: hypothetical protein VFI91_00965 [Longimicrobiaceae bacterium]|nr:hypothetical protein [Longimicrobiaceae bacterium]